jgi:hypothetical protein
MARGAKKSTGPNKTIFVAAALVMLVFILFMFNPQITSMFDSKSGADIKPTAAPLPTVTLKPDYPPELYARLKAYQDIPEADAKRPAYFGSITNEVFKDLPPFPKDFYIIKLLFELGKITDGTKITPEYWKQPEFYPQFEDQGVAMMANPPTGRWGAFGYGTYPSETVVLTPRNNKFRVIFFLHTSWLVQTYQGMGLSYSFPRHAELQKTLYPDNTKAVLQDPANVSKYFHVKISPDVILLEPAFPVVKNGWAHAIAVDVEVKNAPPGKYAIGVDIGDAPSEKANEWLWKYKTNYVGGSSHSIGIPWYTIFVQV